MGDLAGPAIGEGDEVLLPATYFLKPSVVPGVLPRMCREILTTRVMVKRALRRARDRGDRRAERILDATQRSLKLVANVTYGYTAANFSGRMPCSDLADAIVEQGRRAIEAATTHVREEGDEQYGGAHVLYGDTDSIFVAVPQASVPRAFEVGARISEAVSAAAGSPVLLELEKVYHGLLLMAKKRYSGMIFEAPDQAEPTFDDKGIETVRRDGTRATQKVVERSLRILYETRDLSALKEYLLNQVRHIQQGRVNMRDFLFAPAVKAADKYRGSGPAGAMVAAVRARLDPMAGAGHKERVPYFIGAGLAASAARDRAIHPLHALRKPGFRLDAHNYIHNQILNGVDHHMSLVGVEVKEWAHRARQAAAPVPRQVYGVASAAGGLDRFLREGQCRVCRQSLAGFAGAQGICDTCVLVRPAAGLALAMQRLDDAVRADAAVRSVCHQCLGSHMGVDVDACVALDCEFFYERHKRRDLVNAARHTLDGLEERVGSMF